MGLKDFFKRWGKDEDARVVERTERESTMTPAERAVDQEDFEARKDDASIGASFAGGEATEASDSELSD